MKAPNRLVWSEGMFMSPHHFQQLDRYHEDLLSARLNSLLPFAWGIVDIRISSAALAAGQFQLEEFAAIMPDGTPVAFAQGQQEAPQARQVEAHFLPTQQTLDVYLAIPKAREGVENFAGTSSRYAMDERSISDTMGIAKPIQVCFAKRNTAIVFGGESREGCDTIKVAILVRDSHGGLSLCEPFVPSCLRIGASEFIVSGLRRTLALMVSKQRDLAEMRRRADGGKIQFAASDVTEFLQLNTLNTFIPVLNHMAETADISPRELYVTLIQLAGQLGTFTEQANPSALPKFTYTDLRQTFEPLFARLIGLIRTAVRERFVTIPLEKSQDGVLSASLDERLLGATFVLAVRSEQPSQTVGEQVPRLAKLAASSQIHAIVRSAMPGVPLQLTHRPPSEIPVSSGMVYFLVATHDRYWQSVIHERTLAIYLSPPYDPSSTEVSLLAVPQAS